MDVLKKNPVFSALLALFILLFIGGIVMIFMTYGQVQEAEKSVQSAKRQLDSALALEPAPIPANVESAEANVAALKEELKKRIQSTLGKKPKLLKGTPPASGTQMLFQLSAYRNELAQLASRTIPYGVGETTIQEKKAAGEPVPSTTIPNGFEFGFSRYIGSGNPPKDADVPKIYQQYEILNYLLRKLMSTGPKSIVSVQRGPVELPPPPANPSKYGNKNPDAALKADEFRIGSESAAVEGAVETMAFKIVFTGYTENLRLFLKQVEEFEAPIVVRSVEVKPVESSVAAGASQSTNADNNDPFKLFNNFGGQDDQQEEDEPLPSERKPIVTDNVSEFTVVLEYIKVNFTETADNASEVEGEEVDS